MRPCIKDGIMSAHLLDDVRHFDNVVLSGGDGTAAALTSQMRGLGIPTLIYPSGTANLLATNLELPLEPAALAKIVAERKVEAFDLGKMRVYGETLPPRQQTQHNDSEVDDGGLSGVQVFPSAPFDQNEPGLTSNDPLKHIVYEHGFSLIATVGYGADMMAAAKPYKEHLGASAYYMASLSKPQPTIYQFTLEIDGKTIYSQGIGVLVINFGQLPFELPITHQNSPQDGLFHIAVLTVNNIAELMPTLVSVLLDRNGAFSYRPNLEVYHGSHVTITSDKPASIQYDGEIIEGTWTRSEYRIIPGASHFIVP